MVDLTGQTVGQYRLVERLGAGGMAEVYKAYHPQLDRHVAIKFIRPELAIDENFQTRFEQEAKTIARLSHGNIVHVYNFDKEDQRYYLVMEFVEGQTLKDYLQSLCASGKTLVLTEAVAIIQQIGEALDYAHRQGIIHRDVKPDNILMTPTGRAVLNDFGIAKIMEGGPGLTSTGAAIGTPAYMSPEQVQGDKSKIGPASDLYSLGVILYELVTGTPPFIADTRIALMLKHVSDPILPPHIHNPALPESIERVIYKALVKEPKDRYATVGEMVQALRGAMVGDMVASGKPVETLTRIAQPTAPQKPAAQGTHWVWVAVGGLVVLVGLVLVGGLVGGLVFGGGRSTDQTPPAQAVAALAVLPTSTPPLATLTPLPTPTSIPPTINISTATLVPSPLPTTAPPTPANTSPATPSLISVSVAPTDTSASTSESAITAGNIAQVTSVKLLDSDGTKQVVWSPDGKLLAVATYHIYLYQAPTLEQLYSIDSVQWVDSLAFSPDGSILASASTDGVKLWDAASGGELRTLAGSKNSKSVAFSPDGAMLATLTGSAVKLWNATNGSELLTIPAGNSQSAIAFSPDGRIVAAAGGIAGQDIKLWEVEDGGELRTLTGHSNWIYGLAFSPDGQILASGSVDNTVKLWDVTSGRLLHTLAGHTDQVTGVAFSPDGRLLASASWDLTVKIWEVASGQELRTLTGHTEWVQTVAFSPDGSLLASGANDRTTRLWGLPQ